MRIFNIEFKKVGGIRFLKLGRLQFSFCVCRSVPKTFQWQGERYNPAARSPYLRSCG